MPPAPIEDRHLLPRLADPTPSQLLLAGVAIAIAVILLGAVAARIAQQVQLLQWWVPLVFIGGIAAADFASGLVHWGADTWGRADLPVIGPRLLVPFRVHHLNPDDFLRRRFLDTNGDVAAVTIPALVVLMVIPLDSAWAHVVAVGGFACCALGGMTNQIHQWAHMPSPPAVARALQKAVCCCGRASMRGIIAVPTTRGTASRPDGATARSKPFDSSGGSKTSSPVSRESCRGPTNAVWPRKFAGALGRWRRMSDHTREARRGVDGENTSPASRSRAHLALETTEPMSAGHGFISGLLSALLGIAGFGLVLCLRFPE